MFFAVIAAVVLGGFAVARFVPAAVPVPAPAVSPQPVPASTVAVTGVRVIYGDTLDVKLGGRTVRVRLLNVDAPEAGHDGSTAQCLSGEASKWLAQVAGKGKKLKLSTYGKDRFGRTLGGLHDTGGRLVNAELVGAGLAAPFVVNGQVDLITPVRAAQQVAATAGVGLHASTGCTVPGRLGRLEATIAGLSLESSDREAAARELAKARTARSGLAALAADLAGDERNVLVDGLTDREVTDLLDRLAMARGRLDEVTKALQAKA